MAISKPNIIDTNLKFTSSLTKRSTTDYIAIHHAAFPISQEQNAALYHQWHLARDFIGIGYAYVIKADGTIEKGRGHEYIGAQIANHNSHGFGICLAGNFEIDQPREAQIKSLIHLLAWLKTLYPQAKIIGHKDLQSSSCPGKNLYSKLNEINKKVNEALASGIVNNDINISPTPTQPIYIEDLEIAIAWATEAGITDGKNILGNTELERVITWLYRYNEQRKRIQNDIINNDPEKKQEDVINNNQEEKQEDIIDNNQEEKQEEKQEEIINNNQEEKQENKKNLNIIRIIINAIKNFFKNLIKVII